MAKHKVKLSRDHGPHRAGSVIDVSAHTLMTFRDRMEPVGASAAESGGSETSVFASSAAEKLAKEENVTAEQLQAWRKPSSESGYTKPDVQAFIDERAAAAALAEEERQAVIFAAKAEELGKPVEELTDEEKAEALAAFDDEDDGGEA